MTITKTPIIDLRNVQIRLGQKTIINQLDLHIFSGEITGIIGASGCGKTTLLRSMIGLTQPTEGEIKLFDQSIWKLPEEKFRQLQQRFGMLFQRSALFSSLTVVENVLFPLRQFSNLSLPLLQQIALLKILIVGLPLEAAFKYPSELSGGMQKRAAAARAIALDPELLFLDEPTTGLDPKSAEALDDLILHVRDAMGLTIVMVSHDLDSLWRVTDRVVFLGEGKVLAHLPMRELIHHPHPAIAAYFSGPRAGAERAYLS
jgi:phospholipid/cholesterol/gamma-HCH transport system ATP-binding protein